MAKNLISLSRGDLDPILSTILLRAVNTNLSIFEIKFGHCKLATTFLNCYKLSSLTIRIEIEVNTKFDDIDYKFVCEGDYIQLTRTCKICYSFMSSDVHLK